MFCLRCISDMEKTIFEGVLVDFCPTCHSFWLDEGELHSAVYGKGLSADEAQSLARKEKAKEAKIGIVGSVCPSCRVGHLRPIFKHGVVLDECSGCKGSFFDHGELREVFSEEAKAPIARIWNFIKCML